MNFLDSCRHLIGLDSTPSRGTEEVAKFCADRCREAGLETAMDAESLNGVGQTNLVARWPGSVKKNEVMFQTHLDTGDPGHFASWTQTQANPFNASIHGGRLFGLGAADTKLDFLCKLEAIKNVGAQNFKRPLALVGTYGAQLGMAGAIKLMRRKLVEAKVAIVGEPTSLRLANAGQGLAVVEIRIPFTAEEIRYRQSHDSLESVTTQSKIFTGKAAHSSNPSIGENAIFKMLDYLAQLPKGIAVMDLDGGISYNTVPATAVMEIDIVGSLQNSVVERVTHVVTALRRLESKMREFSAPDFEPPHPTINLGTIRTEQDHIQLSGSCRMPPTVRDEDYQGWITRIQTDCAEIGGIFSVRDYKAGFQTTANSAAIRAVCKAALGLGLEGQLMPVGTSTEANVFSRFGVECIVVGPGQGVGNSHAPNESVKIDELQNAVEFYQALIKELCL